MERKIKLEEIRKAVETAYDEYKRIDKGEVDARLEGVDANAFGVVFMLNDGTVVKKGDTDVAAPLGNIASFIVHSVLLQQLGAEGLVRKAGKHPDGCCCRALDVPVCPHAVRAVSAVTPTGDFDSKYSLVADNVVAMMGSAPVLDDKLYERLSKEVTDADEENKLADAGYEVFDETGKSLDTYVKLESLTATAEQLADLGVTVAAGGIEPTTRVAAFDGSLTKSMMTLAAVHGRPDRNRRWLLRSGVPAVWSFGGLILAIMPGLGAIAAYSPKVGKHGRSKKGARAIVEITSSIGYNIFSGDTYTVEE